MRKLYISVLAAVVATALWAVDWPMPGGNPQRNGWVSSERLITKANVGGLQLLYKYQTDNHSNGLASLTTPIINGNLITYRGFKEMLMFTGSSGNVFSIDADLNKLIWRTNVPYLANKAPDDSPTSSCPGGLTAPLVMAGSSSASLHFAALAARTPAGKGVRFHRRSPYFPPLAESLYPLLPTTLTQLNALYTVSSDGDLHVLNSSTGQDLIPAMRFVPPNAKVTSLNLRDNVVYATTGSNCDGYRNAVYAIDILSARKTVTSLVAPVGGFAGSAGTTIGNDGTVYVQTAYVPDKQTEHKYEAVVALNPKELTVKDYFILSNKPMKRSGEGPGITPVVFSFPDRDMILAASTEGRLYLLDSRSLGGSNHRTPVFASSTLVAKTKKYAGDGFRGAFSTWIDADSGTRRFYAPVYGTPRGWGRLKPNNSGSGDAFIVALELGGTSEKPTLRPLWISPEMLSPAPAVIANGMVFVLSTGQFPRIAKQDGKPYTIAEREQLAKPARLYVLDAATGKDLYASKDITTGASLSTGLAFANGRAYFSGRDNAVYCFGIPAQHSQLFEQ